jgi:EmrB/QacA subfamily drug resistance transporter
MNSLLASVHGPNHKWWALGVVQTGVLMSTLDAGIVAVSLPSIMSEFHADVATIQWTVLAYLIVITVTLLPFGRLADMYGRKQVYTLGFVIFTIGSGLCGISGSVLQLTLFRAVQALGASMLMANGMAITSSVFPARERGKALGIGGTIVATGTTIGPTIGGILTQLLGWRYIFFVNLPIGLVGTVLALIVLRNSEITPTLSGKRPRFDLTGALVGGSGLLALLLALAGPDKVGLPAGATWPLVACAAVALVAFVVVERRVAEPMIDLGLFQTKLFALGSSAALLIFLAVSANGFLLPFYLQLILNFSPAEAGLLMTPASLMIAVVAPVSGWLSDRIGARLLSSTGITLVSLALFSLSRLGTNAGYPDVLIRLVVLGIGQGMFQSPNNSSVIGSVPRERYGVAGGFLSMMRNLGMVMGTALASSLLSTGLVAAVGHVNLEQLMERGGMDTAAVMTGFMTGMERAYLAGAFLAATGILASLSRGGSFRATSKADSSEQASPDIRS